MKQNRSIPKIRLPFLSPDAVENAVHTIELCRSESRVYDFRLPFFAPGGMYGDCWWSLDYALAVDGYKWIEPACEEDFIANLAGAQCPDGRIRLYGIDDFHAFPNVTVPVSSLPRYFDTGYRVFLRHGDEKLRKTVYTMFRNNLAWWEENRLDTETGLFSALFEETLLPNVMTPPGEYCPPDLNIQLAYGYFHTADMAAFFGDTAVCGAYRTKGNAVLDAVGRYLWNEDRGAYFPYLLSGKRHADIFAVSSFTAMIPGCSGEARRRLLLDKLTDNRLFGWEERPLTTLAKTDPQFQCVEGIYNGNPCWSGSVWTLTNQAVIRALDESGEKTLSGELAVKTVKEFANNYTEFHHPFTGEGHGVKDYAWTAAQTLQILVEDLFGVSFCEPEKTIRIRPRLPKEYREDAALEGLLLPDGETLDVIFEKGVLSYRYGGAYRVTAEE